jgi:hypothetical protein
MNEDNKPVTPEATADDNLGAEPPVADEQAEQPEQSESEQPIAEEQPVAEQASNIGQPVGEPVLTNPTPTSIATTEPSPLAPDPATEPTPANPVFSGQTADAPLVQEIKPSSSNKKKIGIIAGIVAVVLLIAAVLLYFLWYQNKDKVVADAISKAIYAETIAYDAEIEITDGQNQFFITVDAASGANGDSKSNINLKYSNSSLGQTFNLDLTGTVITTNALDIYIKLDGIETILNVISAFAVTINGSGLPSSVTDVIKKIDGQWLKVTADDLAEVSEEYVSAQKCLNDTMAQWQNNKTVRDEIVGAYAKSPFIVVGDKVGEESGNVGYQVTLSQDKAKVFGVEFQGTTIYKTLNSCELLSSDTGSSTSSTQSSSIDNAKIEVWVSKFQHELTKLNFNFTNGTSTTTATLKPLFDQPVEVTIPANVRSAKEVIEEIVSLLQTDTAQTADDYADSDYNYDYDYGYDDDYNYDYDYDYDYETDYIPVYGL